eukprot:gene11365-17760_t
MHDNQQLLEKEARELHGNMRQVVRQEHSQEFQLQEKRAKLLQQLSAGLDQQGSLEQRCYGLLCQLWDLPAPQV